VRHTALRASGSSLPSPAPRDALEEIAGTLQRIDALVHAVGLGDASAFGVAPGITDVVNIGIGGSDLGPRLAVRALEPYHVPGVRSHFLTNVDGQSAYELMHRLDPRRTLVVVVSKTFTTQETLLNGNVMREWISRAYHGDAAAVSRHFLAVSANVAAAEAWGVPAAQVYPMWAFVGGRFSLWSAVGLSLALAIGSYNFHALL
jgi:glucose-6-phosphate isomerase